VPYRENAYDPSKEVVEEPQPPPPAPGPFYCWCKVCALTLMRDCPRTTDRRTGYCLDCETNHLGGP
jgi:hypothetical protein